VGFSLKFIGPGGEREGREEEKGEVVSGYIFLLVYVAMVGYWGRLTTGARVNNGGSGFRLLSNNNNRQLREGKRMIRNKKGLSKLRMDYFRILVPVIDADPHLSKSTQTSQN